MRRRSFSLVELLIGLVLVSLLFSTLFTMLWQTSRLGKRFDEKKHAINAKRLAISRITQVLMHVQKGAAAQSSQESGPKEYFYLEESANSSPSLVFTYDGGIDLDPLFSNVVLGKLYLDNHSNLCLASWPNPHSFPELETHPMRHEVLLSDIGSIEYTFIPSPQGKKSSLEKLSHDDRANLQKNEPLTTWKQEFPMLPALITITITHKAESDLVTKFSLLFPKTVHAIHIKE